MSSNRIPSPDEARASLDDIAASRSAAVNATRRPAWLDGVLAAGTGAALGIIKIGGWGAIAGGIVVLLVVGVVHVVLDRRLVRHRGRILDERSIGAQAATFLPMYFVVFATTLFQPDGDWQPWYSIGVGLVVALAGYVYLRVIDRYQARRLAAGDYHRHDLL